MGNCCFGLFFSKKTTNAAFFRISFLFLMVSYCLVIPISLFASIESKQANDTVLDIGVIKTGQIANNTITVKNTNKTVLKIAKATSSCECLKIISYPAILTPQTTSQIQFSLAPSKAGNYIYKITLESADNPPIIMNYLVNTIVEGDDANGSPQKGYNIAQDNKFVEELAISCEAALQAKKDIGKTVFVDIRDKNKFDKYRIPSSINIPAYAIKSKTFLKGKTIVLVNEGCNYILLAGVCKDLKKEGFDVKVLNGGIKKWIQKGYVLEGKLPLQKELYLISPENYFPGENGNEWVYVDISDLKKNNENNFDGSVSVPAGKNLAVFVASLKKVLQKSITTHGYCSLLLFNSSGNDYDSVEKTVADNIIKESNQANIYFLDGGVEGYKAYLNKQGLLMQPMNGKVTSYKVVNGRARAKPCSTCP